MNDFDFSNAPIMFVLGLIATGAGVVAWSYDQFQAKDIARSTIDGIERRLDRIENKVDKLIEAVR